MKWKDVKLAALQLMFSNDGAVLNRDDANEEYLNAMPASVNQALSMVTAVGVPILHKLTVRIDPGAAEAGLAEGVLTVPMAAGGLARVDMRACCPDFRALASQEIYREAADGFGAAEDWRVEGQDVLVLPAGTDCTYTVYYQAYPTAITAETADDFELDVPREAAELAPLFIASQLYREDDIQMSTQMRNEFEDGLAKLKLAYEQRPAGGGGTVRNTTGWW